MNPNQFIEIDAPKLCVMEGESAELINPDTYGKALGLYLQSKLVSFDYEVPFVGCEDWGWYVSVVHDGFEMSVCVYGRPEGDSLDHQRESSDEFHTASPGTKLSLCVHVATQPRKYWSWKKFRFIDRSETVIKLNDDISAILDADPEITIVQYCEEFPL